MDKTKGYMEWSEEEIISCCTCCGEKAVGRIRVGTIKPLEIFKAARDDGTIKPSDSMEIYLCDSCKEQFLNVVTSKKYRKDCMGKIVKINKCTIERKQEKKIESVFDIFDVDKMNEEKEKSSILNPLKVDNDKKV